MCIITSTSSNAWIAALGDTGIKSDLQTLAASGTLGYSGALQILTDVAGRGAVSAQEFADLQTIAGHLETQSGISSSSYVASIFYQLADGSQANATWNAGAANSTPLGNLAAGTTAGQMNQLIGKWFLGTDMPDPTTTGSAATDILHPTYKAYSLPLFGTTGTPQISDVAQGDVGDCEFCAGLIEVIQNDPSLIQSMIVDDGNGAYGVRFYVNGKETWVTVNNQLPVYQGGLIFNNAYVSNPSAGFWADLVEKAYAQLSADGNIGHPNVNSYDNVAADTAFSVLTNLVNAPDVQYFSGQAANWNSYKTAIINAINQHDDVVLETDPNGTNVTDASGKLTLVADHAFAVIGYDAATGDFIVRNPWGVESNTLAGIEPYETQFEVSMADVVKVNGDIVVDDVAAPNVVITNAANVAALASLTNSAFNPTASHFTTGGTVAIAPLLQVSDAAGLPVTQYMLQVISSGSIGSIQLNGATNLATTAQTAAGEIVVSAADFAKLTVATGTTTGTFEMLVSGNDGTGWGVAADLFWTVDSNQAAVLPTVDTIVAPSASVAVSNLFKLSGPQAGASGITYFVSIESGGGVLNLNGGTDILGGGVGAGQVQVSAADLAKLTYTASANSGIAVLDVTASIGGTTTSLMQVPVDVGYTVANALSVFNQGQTPFQVAVSDTAANIFANLDNLQQMVPNWALLGIEITDTTTSTQSISVTQFNADKGAISLISGNYNLIVTDVPVAQISAFKAQAHVSGVGITATAAYVFNNLASLESQLTSNQIVAIDAYDDGSLATSVSVAGTKTYAAVLTALTGSYHPVVSDSAANVLASLDSLETLAVTGKIGGIALTDPGAPTLTVTSAQFTADHDALQDLAGYPVIDVTATGASQTLSGVSGHASVLVFSGTASQYSISLSGGTLSVTNGGATVQATGFTALQFSDHEIFVASQTPAVTGAVSSVQVADLYSAVFARTPDAAGLNFYELQAANNATLGIAAIAQEFLGSPEYTGSHNYAQGSAGDAQFITDTYNNLLHRAPDSAAAIAYYQNVINQFTTGLTPGTTAYAAAETQGHALVLAYFSLSAEFLGNVQITSAHPADTQHWLYLI